MAKNDRRVHDGRNFNKLLFCRVHGIFQLADTRLNFAQELFGGVLGVTELATMGGEIGFA